MKPQPCKQMRRDDTTGYENVLQWGNGVNNRIYKHGHILCSDQVIHFYAHPLQAAFFSPIHVSAYTKLREVIYHSKMVSDGTKCAAKSVTTGKEIPLPEITPEQRVEIAIRCVLKVYHEPKFVKWANNWLNGIDRSPEAAYAVYETAYYAAHAAYDATNAAYYAARVAYYASHDVAYGAVCAVSCTKLPADQILQIIKDVVGWEE